MTDAAALSRRWDDLAETLRALAFPRAVASDAPPPLDLHAGALDTLALRLVEAGYEIVPVHRGALKTGQSAFVQLVHLERALAERNAAQAELAAARKYAVAWVAVARAWAGGADIDGFTLQEIGVKSGALLETVYDPAIHGEAECEPGDTYYTLPPDARALAPAPEMPP